LPLRKNESGQALAAGDAAPAEATAKGSKAIAATRAAGWTVVREGMVKLRIKG
jgi:hypothetical protein